MVCLFLREIREGKVQRRKILQKLLARNKKTWYYSKRRVYIDMI